MREHAEFLSALGGSELAEEVAELPSTLPLAEEEKQA
jgi:hypothetical protein